MIDDIDMTSTEVSTDEEGDVVEYTMHNPNTNWNLMRPIEKERYENIEQLKFAITNYAVANGYPLQFTKCDHQRLQIKCGKSQDGETCPFSLWATRIGNDESFQIKKIVEKHLCIRSYDFGSNIMTIDWIAKHYMKVFIARPKIKLRELKAEIEKEFPSCNVSMTRCFKAKKRAEDLMEEKLSDVSEVTMPSVKRKRHVFEKDDKFKYRIGRVKTCKNCFEKGHNVRSCKNEKKVLPPKKKKKIGRPRKTFHRGRFGKVEGENLKKLVEEENNKLHVNTIVDDSEDGDEDVNEIQATVDDLRKSGYTKNEIDDILANKAQEDDDDEHGISLHEDALIEAQNDDEGIEEEEDDDDDGDGDEWIEKTQPPIAMKVRRPSERILKNKLGKKIEGRGSAMDSPIDIE